MARNTIGGRGTVCAAVYQIAAVYAVVGVVEVLLWGVTVTFCGIQRVYYCVIWRQASAAVLVAVTGHAPFDEVRAVDTGVVGEQLVPRDADAKIIGQSKVFGCIT